jgi:hypothetical protein
VPAGDGDDVAADAVAVLADGRIVVAGHATDETAACMLVARFNPDGTPDAGVGSGGISLTAVGPDARPVVAGQAISAGVAQFALARYVGVTAPGPGPAVDLVPPTVTAGITNRRFRVGRRSTPIVAARRAPVGTTFRITLSGNALALV